MTKKRVFVIIIDGVGIGALPDADRYGDAGSNTLANIARYVGGADLPNLEKLGLGKIEQIKGLKSSMKATGNFGKMAEASPGKDSTTGHWELAGLQLDQPFPTYPQGFPREVLDEFTRLTGYETIANYPASGTEIIRELGEEHIESGKLIVYTSADSVFQIAAHQEVLPLEKLYEVCRIARNILRGEHAVARVIARPFKGDAAHNFERTKYRKDFSLKPFDKILFNNLSDANIPTVAIGKINDLYASAGIAKGVSSKTNQEGMAALINEMSETPWGYIMINLVDFDMLWGHRNDTDGFYNGLQVFDRWLPEFTEQLKRDDIVFITADHGNDPTSSSTDHSREYVPLLAFGPSLKEDVNLETRDTFADLEATIAEYFGVETTGCGTSFLAQILA